jgi:hypothetical protein
MKYLYRHRRIISVFFLAQLAVPLLLPLKALALTGGPSQPEVQSFESANTNQMVDLFTGDFVYNIPLGDVEGYPLNLSYHSGITMDQEAGLCGLGFSFNPGSVTRNKRGLPDDFMGDQVQKQYNMNKNWTAGIDIGAGLQVVGMPFPVDFGMGIYYNNYRGIGFRENFGFVYQFAIGDKGENTTGLGGSVGLSITFDSQSGIGVSPSMGLSLEKQSDDQTNSMSVGLNAGLSYNSRSGITQVNLSGSGGWQTNKSQTNQSSETPNSSDQEDKKDGESPSTLSGDAVSSIVSQEISGITGVGVGANGQVSSFSTPNIGSSISFANPAVNPTVNFPMRNFAFSGKLSAGGEIPIAAIDVSGNITGSYSEQTIAQQNQSLPGYGYMYMDQANQDPSALLDFNLEKDQPFRKPKPILNDEGTPVMAIPNYDYDLFVVSGQGIGGQYRLKRSDVGQVYEHNVNSGSGKVDVNIGIGGYVHVGGHVDANLVTTTTGQWNGNNGLFSSLRFYGYNNTGYEPVSFVNVGEKTIADQDLYEAYGADSVFRVKLGGPPFARTASRSIETFNNGQSTGNLPLNLFKKAQRDKKNQVISYLNAYEAQVGALDTAILDYPVNSYPVSYSSGVSPQIQQINRVMHANWKGHHISEITVLGNDGRRYVYGIPAYNRIQKDVVFNANSFDGDINTGLVTYSEGNSFSGADNSLGNNIGYDHYFSAEITPDYTHSFLLSAVLSADYVDLTGDGPTPDDLGSYVRFNYTRLYGNGEINNGGRLYNWRVPYAKDEANYQEGFKSYTCDDKGNYTYGRKEIWYINSIESKTMVAEFKISDREDAVGVVNENGGMAGSGDTSKLKKLDEIDFYSRADLNQNGANAIPIKSVHFVYDYFLCQGVDNNTNNMVDTFGCLTNNPSANVNEGGKLTLRRIYFTYQNNTQGALNPYVFNYNSNNNPGYQIRHYDRWGNYKSNSEYGGAFGPVPETEYPYTIQDSSYTNKAARAWSLQSIQLPTGGLINVSLESDDYAYVQNQRAMQMFQVVGVGSSTTFTGNNSFYTDITASAQNKYVYVQVDDPIQSTTTAAIQNEINTKYLQNINYLYYRCAVKMNNTDADAAAEYVPGYCQISSYRVCTGDNTKIWLNLSPVPINNSGNAIMNPIAKNALQFFRINLPSEAYPGGDNLSDCGSAPPSALSIVKSLIAPIYDIENIFLGFNKAAMTLHHCQTMVLNRSWVRLNNARKCKLGGGARVKQITISDNWNKMAPGEIPAQYGQVYDYSMVENGDTISSGVAEYEPMVGNDENPFRQPLLYTTSGVLSPHNQLYIEYPLCESFFPAATVGYRQVKVSSFSSTYLPASKQTGYSLHQFYTAYDYPIFTQNTGISDYLDNLPPIAGGILNLPSMDYYTGSQGFEIELNDMHGKPRAEAVYDNTSSLISSTAYTYQTQNPGASPMQLKNLVNVMLPNGTITSEEVGRDLDINTVSRYQNTLSTNIGLQINVDVDAIPIPFPIPVPIPSLYPSFGTETTQFESFSAVKVIRRYGILSQVTAQQYGSSLTTKNLVYDSETGEPLLTQTQNEFNDPVYTFKYPAHFAYPGMASAYTNINSQFTGVPVSNGLIQSPMTSLNQYFIAGDEVLAQYGDTLIKLWVIDPYSVNSAAAHQITFTDANGFPFSPASTTTINYLKIIRSGHRNMQSVPIATITSLSDPTAGGSLNPVTATNILKTEATQYKEEWKVNCSQVPSQICDRCMRPSCQDMYNLISQIAGNNLWLADSSAHDTVSACGLDSCFLPNGSISDPHTTCGRKYYVLTYDSVHGSYTAAVGRCTLHMSSQPVYCFGFAIENFLKFPNIEIVPPTGSFLNGGACENICTHYDSTGEYCIPYFNDYVCGPGICTFTLACPSECSPTCVNLPPLVTINPYRNGLLGNWKPNTKVTYRGFRSPQELATATAPAIRTSGVFTSYTPYWTYNGTQFVTTAGPTSGYINATTITKYDTHGDEIENFDAAGNYSAAVYGYLETLATAVAKNARYKNIGADNFEDYGFSVDGNNPCYQDHFSFRQSLISGTPPGFIDSVTSHTGNYCFHLYSNSTATATRSIVADNEAPNLWFSTDSNAYQLTPNGCLPTFSPDTGKYYVSAWVNGNQSCYTVPPLYTNCMLKINFDVAGGGEFYPSGNIIDGWQRIEGYFNVPYGATQINVQLVDSGSVDVYFDDIRLQPFNGEMKTYVYDSRSLRLMAVLDENNYAVLYEYDDKGILVRIKRETDEGIMTVQETRSVLKFK